MHNCAKLGNGYIQVAIIRRTFDISLLRKGSFNLLLRASSKTCRSVHRSRKAAAQRRPTSISLAWSIGFMFPFTDLCQTLINNKLFFSLFYYQWNAFFQIHIMVVRYRETATYIEWITKLSEHFQTPFMNILSMLHKTSLSFISTVMRSECRDDIGEVWNKSENNTYI